MLTKRIKRGSPDYKYYGFPSALDCFMANPDEYRELGVTMFSVMHPGFYRTLYREGKVDVAFPNKRKGKQASLPKLLAYDVSIIRVARRKYRGNVNAASRATGYRPHQIRKVWEEMNEDNQRQ